MTAIIIKPGRERSILRRHPWIFSGAVGKVEGSPQAGETVEVLTSQGDFLASAAFSPKSQIQARIWSWDPGEKIDEAFFHSRLSRAIQSRRELISPRNTNAMRLVHGESDGLPGLIVDFYADMLVVQILSAGPERWRELLTGLLMELTGAARMYERSDVDVRKLEGLPPQTGILRENKPVSVISASPVDSDPELLQVQENGLRFWVDIQAGHKTGFYLDQRLNRSRLRELAAGRHVLDCFSYTGGFSINALAGGADSVLAVDASADALRILHKNVGLNSLPGERLETLEGDVFQVLRLFRDQGRSFDLIVLDPPKFAQTSSQVERAARGYKDINLLAFKLLRPGGFLVTFSCSGGVSEDLFQKIVAGAALDAGVEAQILERLHQDRDHPVALNFPEGAYLKGFVIRIQ